MPKNSDVLTNISLSSDSEYGTCILFLVFRLLVFDSKLNLLHFCFIFSLIIEFLSYN